MKQRTLILVIIISCLTILDVRNEGCRVSCVRDGYDFGKYSKGQCSCEDQKQAYDDFIHKRLTIGPQPDIPFKSDNKGKGQSLEVFLPDDWNL